MRRLWRTLYISGILYSTTPPGLWRRTKKNLSEICWRREKDPDIIRSGTGRFVQGKSAKVVSDVPSVCPPKSIVFKTYDGREVEQKNPSNGEVEQGLPHRRAVYCTAETGHPTRRPYTNRGQSNSIEFTLILAQLY